MEKSMSAVRLIREFFTSPTVPGLKEIQALTKEEQIQLASAIARERGIPDDELSFLPVNY